MESSRDGVSVDGLSDMMAQEDSSSAGSLTQGLSTPTQGRVMVVDDEPMVTTSICTMLGFEKNLVPLPFNSALNALAAIEAGERPDVVISDFLMPDMKGIEFLKRVREHCPDATLILLTGYADKANAIQAINEAGIYRYIEKPWDNEALKMTIRNGMERTQLLGHLRDKIIALEQAQGELKLYSEHLEEKVTEKTRYLTATLNKLKAIVENTGDAIVTIDHEGKIQGANPTFLSWTTLHLDGAVNQSIYDVLTFMQPVAEADLFKPSEHSLLREAKIGNILAEVNISPLSNEEGAVLVCRDIVKRKEAERLREDFVSTLTHDLRTPLMATIQTLGFLLDGSLGTLDAQQTEILSMMVNSQEQMLSLVNDLLEVYRYEAKRHRLIMAPCQMNEVVKLVVQELSSLAQSKAQAIELMIEGDIPEISGDKMALRRVITNLLGNAINYTPSEGQILVGLKSVEGRLRCWIQDNGRGIPESDLLGLFQRFAQGTSKHRTTGTGLGLYLSRQIVEAHGGTIWAESQEGQGSIFAFDLPFTQSPWGNSTAQEANNA